MADQEETPAQRRRRLGTAGQTRTQFRRPAPLTTTRLSEQKINQGNTPPPSPEKQRVSSGGPRGDNKDVPLFAQAGTGKVVRDIGSVGFGGFGGLLSAAGGSAFGGIGAGGFEKQKNAFGAGQLITPEEEQFKKPGLSYPALPSAGASPGFQVKGAAAATFGNPSGGLGFRGVESSPWSGGGVKAGVKRAAPECEGEQKLNSSFSATAVPFTPSANQQQIASPPSTSWTNTQQTSVPPSTSWKNPHQTIVSPASPSRSTQRADSPPPKSWIGRPAEPGDNQHSQQNTLGDAGFSTQPLSALVGSGSGAVLQPSSASSRSYPSTGFNTGSAFAPASFSGYPADDDFDIQDAEPDITEAFDVLESELESKIEDTQRTESHAFTSQWKPALAQPPALATSRCQDTDYQDLNKQRELELKEEVKRKLQERRKTGETPSMPPQTQSGTPILGQFLIAINGFIKAGNEAQITDYMVIEPPYSDMYNRLISELQQSFPKGAEDALEEKCRQALSAARDGVDGSPTWSQFIRFMAQYLSFLRDVDMDQSKYLETYELLIELQKKANSALTHGQLGYLVLGTVISVAKAVCRLAIGLDRNPHLIAHLKSAQVGEPTNDDEARTLPQRAVEILRVALSSCVTDRASNVTREGKIEGKQRGAYSLANICLKIYFQCRSTRNANLVFQSIGSTTIPISAYSKRERTTYLYYLGRFFFLNNHFERARQCLQQAYNECSTHDHSIRQRRYILVFLIASSLIVGRFPSQAIFQRPEAQGLQERFLPLMQAIRSGNLALFRQHMSFDSPHADWFLHFRILLQLKNRCEVLVWRSLVRKIWILNGTRFDPKNARQAVTIDLNDLAAALSALGQQSCTPDEEAYIDPDFDGAEDQVEAETLPDLRQAESIIASLVSQGLLRGFIAHRMHKFCIIGVRAAGGDVFAAGFPQPWKVIEQKTSQEEGHREIPGWQRAVTGGAMAGKVVNLAGARAVGAA